MAPAKRGRPRGPVKPDLQDPERRVHRAKFQPHRSPFKLTTPGPVYVKVRCPRCGVETLDRDVEGHAGRCDGKRLF